MNLVIFFTGLHHKKSLTESLMANPDAPERGVITSIATTITIGSNTATNNTNSSGDACSISHSTNQLQSGFGGVGDNNTFRPIIAPHQSPSLSRHHTNKSIEMPDRNYRPHIDKYTSLPRAKAVPQLQRPSSR